MKKRFLQLIIIGILAFSLPSCKKDNFSAADFYGTWDVVDVTGGSSNPYNYTFVISASSKGEDYFIIDQFSGGDVDDLECHVDGDSFTFDQEDSSGDHVKGSGTLRSDKLVIDGTYNYNNTLSPGIYPPFTATITCTKQ